MAIPAPYTRVPYVAPSTYNPENTRTLAALLELSSRERQQNMLMQGQNQAQGRMTLGALIADALGQIKQGREQDTLRKQQTAFAQQKLAQDEQDKQRDFALRAAQFEDLAAQREAAQKEKQDALALGNADRIGKGPAGPISQSTMDAGMVRPDVAERMRYSFGPGTAEGPELMPSPEQQRMAAAEQFVKQQGGVMGPTGPIMPPKAPTEPNPTETSLALAAAKGDVGAKKALEIIAQQRPKSEPMERPSVWVSKGNDMQFVTPSEASRLSKDGWRSGNTREQGRPVTSMDAGKIADLDTGVQLLDQLAPKLAEPGATGIEAQIGAAVPNAITQWTGWGADAKSRQATIDQVKQIIGKALEGGVLRKEDEVKYEKILPTIKDAPEVAKSKLEGLRVTLQQKRQNQLDNLQDAGYEVGRFVERGGVPRVAPQGFSVVAPDGKTYQFKTQAALDAFKSRAGIK